MEQPEDGTHQWHFELRLAGGMLYASDESWARSSRGFRYEALLPMARFRVMRARKVARESWSYRYCPLRTDGSTGSAVLDWNRRDCHERRARRRSRVTASCENLSYSLRGSLSRLPRNVKSPVTRSTTSYTGSLVEGNHKSDDLNVFSCNPYRPLIAAPPEFPFRGYFRIPR